MLQSPAQRGDTKKPTSATSALPLLVLLVIPGFCLVQMQFDHWVARRKRAREAKHAEAEEAFTAGSTTGGGAAAASNDDAAAKAASTPAAAAISLAAEASGSGSAATTQAEPVTPSPA